MILLSLIHPLSLLRRGRQKSLYVGVVCSKAKASIRQARGLGHKTELSLCEAGRTNLLDGAAESARERCDGSKCVLRKRRERGEIQRETHDTECPAERKSWHMMTNTEYAEMIPLSCRFGKGRERQ